jgi:3-methyladenine DNA glycosylase AlkD
MISPINNRNRATLTAGEVVQELKKMGTPRSVEGMARFGIQTKAALGISLPELRRLGQKLGKNHGLAGELWNSGIHEARLLAGMIDDFGKVTEDQMERWVVGFDSWDVVDNCCGNLFDKTPFAFRKALEWSRRPEEYVKRAGFVMMAELAVHDKTASDKAFLEFLPVVVREATDDRNFVKKAVNWALRQIGKRNLKLNQAAIQTAKEVHGLEARSAKWIASDALRELTSEAVQSKLKRATSSAKHKRSE